MTKPTPRKTTRTALFTIYNQRTGERNVLATGSALLILYLLAGHSDDLGWAFPGLDRLSRLSGMHRATVSRDIAKLEDAHVIEVHRRQGEVNHYTLLYHQDHLLEENERVRDDELETYAGLDLGVSDWLVNRAAKDPAVNKAIHDLDFRTLNKLARSTFRRGDHHKHRK